MVIFFLFLITSAVNATNLSFQSPNDNNQESQTIAQATTTLATPHQKASPTIQQCRSLLKLPPDLILHIMDYCEISDSFQLSYTSKITLSTIICLYSKVRFSKCHDVSYKKFFRFAMDDFWRTENGRLSILALNNSPVNEDDWRTYSHYSALRNSLEFIKKPIVMKPQHQSAKLAIELDLIASFIQTPLDLNRGISSYFESVCELLEQHQNKIPCLHIIFNINLCFAKIVDSGFDEIYKKAARRINQLKSNNGSSMVNEVTLKFTGDGLYLSPYAIKVMTGRISPSGLYPEEPVQLSDFSEDSGPIEIFDVFSSERDIVNRVVPIYQKYLDLLTHFSGVKIINLKTLDFNKAQLKKHLTSSACLEKKYALAQMIVPKGFIRRNAKFIEELNLDAYVLNPYLWLSYCPNVESLKISSPCVPSYCYHRSDLNVGNNRHLLPPLKSKFQST